VMRSCHIFRERNGSFFHSMLLSVLHIRPALFVLMDKYLKNQQKVSESFLV